MYFRVCSFLILSPVIGLTSDEIKSVTAKLEYGHIVFDVRSGFRMHSYGIAGMVVPAGYSHKDACAIVCV